MLCCKPYWFVVWMAMMLSVPCYAQQAGRISGNFSNLSFEEFVKKVEAVEACHFYYDHKDVDSVIITLQATNLTLQQLLSKALTNTRLQFAIDEAGNVFVSKNYRVQTALPIGFFDKKRPTEEGDTATVALPSTKSATEKATDNSIENRLIEIGTKAGYSKNEKVTLVGYVKDTRSGEPLAGAGVYVDSPYINVITDQYGYYTLILPAGRNELHIKSFGMKETKRQLMLYNNGKLNIEMSEYVATLKDVTVTAEKNSNTLGLQMGVNKLTINNIKQVPTVMGEADILKVVLTLPGVTSVGEASTGFNVRGGASDQNLILLNDATVYNPSHLFGFFSAFNPDVVKGVELYKSAIPEKYGGRLSSVLDVTTLDGNNKKFAGNGGIGPLTCKLSLEGPIKKNKSSFIVGGRTTYSNWILRTLKNPDYKTSKAAFSDFTLHFTQNVNEKNNISVTGYFSNDKFRLRKDTSYQYSNGNANIKWKHNFSNRLYGIATAGIDKYSYENSSESNKVTAYSLKFNIQQLYLRTDFNYSPSASHIVSFGFNTIRYQLKPGNLQPNAVGSLVTPDIVPTEQGLESAIYLGDKYTVTPNFSINAGVRLSMFNYLGPYAVSNYVPGVPRSDQSIKDTSYYGKGDVVKTYLGPEWRIAMRYALPGNASLKLSYNSLRQYIHMLSNTTAISPTDIWKLSDPHIKPQTGDQLSLGYYRNFKSNTIETSVEVYYKRIHNFLDYKSGATLLLNHHIETDVFATKGHAYGAELLIKKTAGALNGWVSYTYSRTLIKTDDPIAGELINKGNYYPTSFDKPHNINFIANYRFSHRYSVSMNMVYSTGRPITLPIAIYYAGGAQRVLYSDRNQYRVPDYFRTDLAVNIDGNHKIKKLAHSFWSFGVYNLTARKNVYSIYFTEENGHIKGYQLSIFGSCLPYISYNFRF